MKKYLFIAIFSSLCFYGCIAVLESNERISVTGYDFTPYATNNFLFTTDSYSAGDYLTMGYLNVAYYPYVLKKSRNKESTDYYNYYIGEINTKAAIDSMYKVAVSMEANAIINFKVERSFYLNGNINVPYVVVSGLAIKRKN